MHQMASLLGSDCPFFLLKEPAMMEGRGELLSPIRVDIGGLYLVLLFPGIHIPTTEAYAEVVPEVPPVHLRQLVSKPVTEWKGHVANDFEKGVFRKYPELEILKRGLYDAGALYASLSGSGSSLYGIFQGPPSLPVSLARLVIWKGMAGPLSPSN
jgi:4-diphosphocytidyl-2-C-methyl-D-erythritol kinase